MPAPFKPIHPATDHEAAGSTLFERMRQSVPQSSSTQDLVIIDVGAAAVDSAIRFERAEIDGQPGVVMKERGEDGSWAEIWSMPIQSVDAREGMIGWLNSQGHRWDRFARMAHRRGPEELTAWIFELMVVPSTHEARAPRFEPQRRHMTIDYYRADTPRFTGAAHRSGWSPHLDAALQNMTSHRSAPAYDDCACRSSGIQSSYDF